MDPKEAERRNLFKEIGEIPKVSMTRIGLELNRVLDESIKDGSARDYISLESLRGFVKFLNLEYNWKYPFISITHSGDVRIDFFRGYKDGISITFSDPENASLSFFKTDVETGRQLSRHCPKTGILELVERMKSEEILDWIVVGEKK